MRSAHRWCRVSWSLLVLGAGVASAADDNKAVDPVLAGKGLTKQGTTFVLADSEKPVLTKLREARGVLKDGAAMANQRGNNQLMAAHAQELEQQRAALQSQMDALTQQMAQQQPVLPGAAGNYGSVGGFGMGGFGGFGYGGQNVGPNPLQVQHEQLRQQLNAVTNEQRTVKNQTPQAKDNAALDRRVQKAEETFRSTLADLRKQVDEVQKQYTDLEADAAVKGAVAEARKANTRIKLGPSEAFVAATRELAQAERQFLDKKPAAAASKKKGAEKAAAKGKK